MGKKVLKMLLMEDNAGDALLFNELLEGSPFEWTVKTTDRLARALVLLGEERFDLVMMDLNLPDSSGMATLSGIRQAVPELPVIVLSGSATDESPDKLTSEGATVFLQKGQLDPEGLWAIIEAVIGQRQKSISDLEEVRFSGNVNKN